MPTIVTRYGVRAVPAAVDFSASHYDPEQPRDEEGKWTEEGGTAKKASESAFADVASEKSKPKSGRYHQIVADNFKHMDSHEHEWSAVPIKGTAETTNARGDVQAMPDFDFPKGYSHAPSLYQGMQDTCELCGHQIKNYFWIQNDTKKWTMAVGSECVTHFTEGKTGIKLSKEAVYKANRDLVKQVRHTMQAIRDKFTQETDKLYLGRRVGKERRWTTHVEYGVTAKQIYDQLAAKLGNIRDDHGRTWKQGPEGEYGWNEGPLNSDREISNWVKKHGDEAGELLKSTDIFLTPKKAAEVERRDEEAEKQEDEPQKPTRIKLTDTESDEPLPNLPWQPSFLPGDQGGTRRMDQGTFFDTSKGPRKEKDRPDQGLLFSKASDDCQWITIGWRKGEDGKKHGGTPVCVRGGQIIKGHPSLTGKKISALDEAAEETTHRKEATQGKSYARAVWAKKARQEGVEPRGLHQLAAEVLAHDKAYKDEHVAALQDARNLAKHFKVDLRRDRGAFVQGDSDQIPHFDELAQEVASRHPEVLGDDPEGKLFDLLAHGNPEPMTEEEAYADAFNHLMERKSREREPEAVPFSLRTDLAFDPNQSRDPSGRWTEIGSRHLGNLHAVHKAKGIAPPKRRELLKLARHNMRADVSDWTAEHIQALPGTLATATGLPPEAFAEMHEAQDQLTHRLAKGTHDQASEARRQGQAFSVPDLYHSEIEDVFDESIETILGDYHDNLLPANWDDMDEREMDATEEQLQPQVEALHQKIYQALHETFGTIPDPPPPGPGTGKGEEWFRQYRIAQGRPLPGDVQMSAAQGDEAVTFYRALRAELRRRQGGETDLSKWVTIGGTSGESDGKPVKHKGGHSVEIDDDGRIIKGNVPKEWQGKHVSEIWRTPEKGKKGKAEPEEPKKEEKSAAEPEAKPVEPEKKDFDEEQGVQIRPFPHPFKAGASVFRATDPDGSLRNDIPSAESAEELRTNIKKRLAEMARPQPEYKPKMPPPKAAEKPPTEPAQPAPEAKADEPPKKSAESAPTAVDTVSPSDDNKNRGDNKSAEEKGAEKQAMETRFRQGPPQVGQIWETHQEGKIKVTAIREDEVEYVIIGHMATTQYIPKDSRRRVVSLASFQEYASQVDSR